MRKLSKIALLVLAGWSLPCIAAAQTASAPTPPSGMSPAEQDRMKVEQMAAQGRGGRVVAPVEARVTTGKPYSAEAVTESLQVLGDGNRISKKSITRVYRDNDGRTRREQFDADGTVRTITISDPVGQVSYTLNPETKTGSQSSILGLRPATLISPGGSATAQGSASGTAAASGGAGGGGGGRGAGGVGGTQPEREEIRKVEQARVARIEQAETSQAASGQARQVLELAASGRGQATKENLGEQVIEGVRATGSRTTTIIPAGSSVGNLNEIRIVSEQWFSPDLDVLVLTKHSDPRVGETVYKLTNIVRAQPDPNLFVAPADYTIKGRTIRYEQ